MTVIRKLHSDRSGFTLLELLIFSAIFAVLSVTFMGILVSVLRIQARQSGAAEVGQQSQFLAQVVQYYVERSSLIDMPVDTATTTLTLRMPSSGSDPIAIYVSGGIMYLTEAGGTPQALTSDRVTISNLTFTRRANAPGHDIVSIAFTVAFNTSGTYRQFSQTMNMAVARVAAASFDSNLNASTTATYNVGTAAGEWKSINNTLYFSGSNVGVGVASPAHVLQVSGGDVYVDTSGKGLILKNGSSCWRYAPNASSTLVANSTTCL